MESKRKDSSKIEDLLFIYQKEKNTKLQEVLDENENYIYPSDVLMNEPNNAYGCPKVSSVELCSYCK